jgi:tetratricopeptide (TPR) repeat protein
MKGDPQRDYYGYGHYWLARRNADTPAGYEFEPLPVPDRILQLWPAQAGNYPVSLMKREDINSDGLPELIFRTSSAVPSGNSTGTYRHMYIVGWQDDEPVRLLRDSVITEDWYPWQENNLDDDPAQEIVRRIRYQNNWLCYRYEDVIYDWTGTTYEHLETVSHYGKSVECAVSQAEEAMHDDNYPAAIEHYREAIKRYGLLRDPQQREWLAGWEGFASERLAIALAFNGEMDAAFETIQLINQQPQPENTMAHALGQRITRNSSLLEICQVANQAVSDFPHEEDYRGIPYFNLYVDENFRTEMSIEHPGCRVSEAVPVTIAQMEFPVGENPMALLARRGLDGESETGDYNGDGIDDWFIWIYPGAHDYLLMSGDDGIYGVYPTGVSSRDWYDDVRAVTLPDGTTRAVMLVHATSYYLCGEDIPCEPDRVPDTPEYQSAYRLTLLYIKNGDMIEEEIRVPADYYRSEMAVLPDEWQLVRGVMRTYRGTYNGIQAHVWDDVSMDYVLQNPPLLPEDTDWRDRTPLPFEDKMRALLYEKRDYDAVIQQVDEALQMPAPPQELQLRYYRAVALQQTGQIDAARDAYTAVHRDAPNSAWGTLSQWYADT